MDSFTFIERIREVTSTSELNALLEEALSTWGFHMWAYQLPPGAQEDSPEIISNFPDFWVERYIEQGYSAVDPVITEGTKRRSPFQWSQLIQEELVSDQQRDFFEEAKDVGLVDGLGVPIPQKGAQDAMLTMVSPDTGNASSSRGHRVDPDLIAIAMTYHAIKKDLGTEASSTEPATPLTEREKECLVWASRGKSAWVTGEILNISERTVKFHIENARIKYGVASKEEALLKAVYEGIIKP